MTYKQLILALNTERVARFAVHDLLKADHVDRHQYRVALFYAFLGGKELLPALVHDMIESITGDLPSPIKKYLTGLDTWDHFEVPFKSKYEKHLCKIADKLDIVYVLGKQKQLTGRLPRSLRKIYIRDKATAIKMAKELKKIKEVRLLLKEVVK